MCIFYSDTIKLLYPIRHLFNCNFRFYFIWKAYLEICQKCWTWKDISKIRTNEKSRTLLALLVNLSGFHFTLSTYETTIRTKLIQNLTNLNKLGWLSVFPQNHTMFFWILFNKKLEDRIRLWTIKIKSKIGPFHVLTLIRTTFGKHQMNSVNRSKLETR